jgi:hypothetical protein
MRDLLTILEAARWAPSSNNAQPWRSVFVRRESLRWPAALDLLWVSLRRRARRHRDMAIVGNALIHQNLGGYSGQELRNPLQAIPTTRSVSEASGVPVTAIATTVH